MDDGWFCLHPVCTVDATTGHPPTSMSSLAAPLAAHFLLFLSQIFEKTEHLNSDQRYKNMPENLWDYLFQFLVHVPSCNTEQVGFMT